MEPSTARAPSPYDGTAHDIDMPDAIPSEEKPGDSDQHGKSNESDSQRDNTCVEGSEDGIQKETREPQRSNPDFDSITQAVKGRLKIQGSSGGNPATPPPPTGRGVFKYPDDRSSDGNQTTSSAPARQGIFTYPDFARDSSPDEDLDAEALEYQAYLARQEILNKEKLLRQRREQGRTG